MAYTWNNGEDLSISKDELLLQLGMMVKQDVFNYFNVLTLEQITFDMMVEVLNFEKTLDVEHPLRLGIYVLFNEWDSYIQSTHNVAISDPPSEDSA